MIETDCSSDFTDIGRDIQEGKVVVYPTDTVFGLGTVPTSEIGVARLFKIKNRILEKKLPVLASSWNAAAELVMMDERAEFLAKEFWPGQLTMILPLRNRSIVQTLVGPDETLAIRIPDHECCVRLISASGDALVGTSANISGSRSFTDPSDRELKDFAIHADYFVRGECGNGTLPSTILDLSKPDKISVVREGAISRKTIADYLSKTSSADFSLRETNNSSLDNPMGKL